MKNVLLISYYFPPSGGPGVQRVLKFTRYLPAHGYRPLVLTVPETAAFPARDPSLATEIPPEAKVFRAPPVEFYGLYRGMVGGADATAPINLSTSARKPSSLRGRILQALRGAFFIPDGRMGWLPAGTREGLRIVRREQVELIFASGPPFTAHWIARRIGDRTGIPLVLDFRDPWTRAPFYPARPGWARRCDERLERSCVRRASAVITVNRAIQEDLRAANPGLPLERFHLIRNGFDPADFAGRAPAPRTRWTLVHTGTLPSHRFPAGFVPALQALVAEEPRLLEEMEIRMLGRADPELAGRLSPPPLDRILRFEGYVGHGDSVQALLDAHCLLLFIEEGPQARGILTGKLFEYIGSGRPVLALAPEGEAAEVIRSTRAGRVVSGDDTTAVLAALREALAAFRSGRRAFGEPDPLEVERLSRPAQTAVLARVFDRILGVAVPPSGV